jgi:hypothetical protein
MSAELFSKLSGATPRGQDEGGFWGSVGVPLVTYLPFCRGVSVSRLGHPEGVGALLAMAPDQRSNSRWPNSDDRTRYRRLVLRDRILRHRLRVLPDQDGQLALTTDRSQPVGTLFLVTLWRRLARTTIGAAKSPCSAPGQSPAVRQIHPLCAQSAASEKTYGPDLQDLRSRRRPGPLLRWGTEQQQQSVVSKHGSRRHSHILFMTIYFVRPNP